MMDAIKDLNDEESADWTVWLQGRWPGLPVKAIASLASRAVLAVALLSQGCSAVYFGRMAEITREQVAGLKIGSSTKRDVLARFGEPQQVTIKPEGVEVLVYAHGVQRGLVTPFFLQLGRSGVQGETLSITLKGQRVVDYTYSVDQKRIFWRHGITE